MTRTVLAVPAQPPELWIKLQVRKQDGDPVSLKQLMNYYKRDEDSLTRMLAAMELQRRVRKVVDESGALIGWTA